MNDLFPGIISATLMLAPVFILAYFACIKRTNRRSLVFLPYLEVIAGFILSIYLTKGFADESISLEYVRVSSVSILVLWIIGVIYYILAYFVFKSDNWFSKQSERFYVYDKEHEKWFLKDKYVLCRKILLTVSIVSCLLSVFYAGVVYVNGMSSLYSEWYFLCIPAAILIFTFDFLNGYTKKEFEIKFGGDSSYSSKYNLYYKVREVLERTFAHELLASGTNYKSFSSTNVKDLLDQMEENGDKIEHTVAEFFRLNGTENVYDTDYINAVDNMLHGKNVIFHDPFYRDLGKYIVLPIMDTLLKGKYVLLVVSRNSTEEDVISWMDDLLYKYGRIRDLWRIEKLSDKETTCEVGVISFSQLYDLTILSNNKQFLKDVGFVFISEPSYILNTGQIGLSVISKQIEDVDGAPIYCVSDRITDGLVDTLSHVLRVEFAEVVAPPVARNTNTAMGWNVDGDFLRSRLFSKQTKYLGNGIEIAATAIKNQIPMVTWYGERKAPVRDIKWLSGQFHNTICDYMNVPIQQETFYEKIKFVSNIWCVPEEKNQFIIAEDEFMNMFSAMRSFISRGREQSFVNILSENYLLRDYMRCNYAMFITNPDAIPCIVPDYVKSERNTIIKLLYTMAYRSMDEEEVLRELHLAEVKTDEEFSALTNLLFKYTAIDNSVFEVKTSREEGLDNTIRTKSVYRIPRERFEEAFKNTLKIAYFICEDENEHKEYIDAKMFGHVTQCILPGQFITYDGKYYYVQAISSDNGVILRRASNLYDERKYYRQIRHYSLGPIRDESIISQRTVMDIQLCKADADFNVSTTGYLDMKDSGNLRSARIVDLSEDPNVKSYDREYHNKTILRIRFPKTSEDERYTICMLLNECMKSIFPDGWQYLAIVTKIPEDVEGMLTYLTYEVSGAIEDDCIYVIEDSEMDLGLLSAFEKNLMQIITIITDFLHWHIYKLKEPSFKDLAVYTPEFPPLDSKRRKARLGFFKYIAKQNQERERKKEEEKKRRESEKAEKEAIKEAEETASKQNSASENSSYDTTTPYSMLISEDAGGDDVHVTLIHKDPTTDSKISNESTEANNTAEIESNVYDELFASKSVDEDDIDGTDIFDTGKSIADREFSDEYFENQAEELIGPTIQSRYQQECFLKFGFDEIDKRIVYSDVHKYFTAHGFAQNSYRNARERENKTDVVIESKICCDFCGLPLTGVSYEQLDDGRIRCNDCSATAVNSSVEMKKLFIECKSLLETFFGIKFNVDIDVRFADSKKIARGFGIVRKPPGSGGDRVLGYASKVLGKMAIFVENGSPRMSLLTTIAHELTHIWQYRNWKDHAIEIHYEYPEYCEYVYEGMAVWVSIQFLYLTGEYYYAERMEKEYMSRPDNDVYKIGFRMYAQKYPLIKDSSIVTHSPFIKVDKKTLKDGEWPL